VEALVSAHAGFFSKASIASQAAGNLVSLWRAAGFPVAPAIPSSPVLCTNATGGAFSLPAFGGKKGYLIKASATAGIAGMLRVYDRLVHRGGLNGASLSAQPVGLSLVDAIAAGRCKADCTDVQWFLEWYTATGSTAVTASVAYVDSGPMGGDGFTSGVSLAATRPAGFLAEIPIADVLPIFSVTSVTLSASTGSAGNFGVTAMKLLAEIPISVANLGVVLDYAALALPEVKPTSCLALAHRTASTSTGAVTGQLNIGLA
jgi:hypothetical protein